MHFFISLTIIGKTEIAGNINSNLSLTYAWNALHCRYTHRQP